MTTHLCYTQDRVHTPYDYIFYRFLYQLAWIAKFSLCSPSALLSLPSYIFRPQPSYIRHLPSERDTHPSPLYFFASEFIDYLAKMLQKLKEDQRKNAFLFLSHFTLHSFYSRVEKERNQELVRSLRTYLF